MPSAKITLIYDSDALPGFAKGWGFSALISTDEWTVLFDCGWNGQILQKNLSRAGAKLNDIEAVVISHVHWDHLSGLTAVLNDENRSKQLTVIVPASFSPHLVEEIEQYATVKKVEKKEEILPGLFSTGMLGTKIKEHCLVLKGKQGGIVLTGCAHPGLKRILSASERISSPAWLIGGLHDCALEEFEQALNKWKDLRIVVCHCTKCKSEARSLGDRVQVGIAGSSYEIEL